MARLQGPRRCLRAGQRDLIIIWAATGGGTFWPCISLAAWGLGLSSQHFLNSFSPITTDRVLRELRRIRDR